VIPPVLQIVQDCVLCGGDCEALFSVSDALGTTDRLFRITRCRQCGLHSLSPRPAPEEALSFYPLDYEPFRALFHPPKGPWQRWLRRRHWRLRCRAVSRFRASGQLLDVGCGTGEFLAELRQFGDWQVCGVEVNPRAAAYARDVLGLAVYEGDLASLDLPARSFDVVTAWDVFEHLSNPSDVIQEIARLLKPDGVLLVTVPNARAWQARLWGKWWAGWEVPRHYYVYTLDALKRLLAAAGFWIVGRVHFPNERYYLVQSWQRKLGARISGDHLGSCILQLTTLFGIALWPVLRLLDMMEMASQIGVAALVTPTPPRERSHCS